MPRGVGDAIGRVTGGNAALEFWRRDEHLYNREAPVIARSEAHAASNRRIRSAPRAQAAQESLSEHPFHRRRDLVRRNTDVDEARDGARRVVGVERGQNQVSRERCLNRDLGGFAIANLADEKHVGVLPHDRAQRRGKGESRTFADLNLDDAGEPILDGIFHSHNVHTALLEESQSRIQRRRLAGARRAGDKQQSLARLQEALDARQLVRREADRVQCAHGGAPIEHADHDFLAVRGRQARGTQIDRDAVYRDTRPAVLWAQAIGDVEARDDLDPRRNGRCEGLGKATGDAHHAVDAMPNDDRFLFRLDMDVAGALTDPGAEQIVHEARNGLWIVAEGRVLVETLRLRGKKLDLDMAFRLGRPRGFGVFQLGVAVCGIDSRGDRVGRRHRESHLAAGRKCERSLAVDVTWIRRRDDEDVLINGEWESAKLSRPAFGDEFERLSTHVAEISDWEMKMPSGDGNQVVLGEDVALDDGFPEAAFRVALEKGRGLDAELHREHGQQPAIAYRQQRRRGANGGHARMFAPAARLRGTRAPRYASARCARHPYKTLQNSGFTSIAKSQRPLRRPRETSNLTRSKNVNSPAPRIV